MVSKSIFPVGRKYNKLTIISEVSYGDIHRRAECLCDCGKEIITKLTLIKTGRTKSCGCLKGRKTHGFFGKRIYRIYYSIVNRCQNKKLKNYGGRGIRCEWSSFEEFYKDMGESYKDGLTIDRIDNSGNYCKKNCRWVTYKENNRNRSNNVVFRGKTLSELREIYGISKGSFDKRYYYNKESLEDIFPLNQLSLITK